MSFTAYKTLLHSLCAALQTVLLSVIFYSLKWGQEKLRDLPNITVSGREGQNSDPACSVRLFLPHHPASGRLPFFFFHYACSLLRCSDITLIQSSGVIEMIKTGKSTGSDSWLRHLLATGHRTSSLTSLRAGKMDIVSHKDKSRYHVKLIK